MFCGILYCFGFNWISSFNIQSEGKVCFKEGKGRSQLLYQLPLGHGKLLSCSGLSQSPIQSPIQKKSLFGSLSVRRFFVYCPVTTLGLPHSVFVIRSEVRIRLAFVHCQQLRSQHQVSVVRLCPPSAFTSLCNFVTVFGWLLGNFGSNSVSRKVGNTTPSPIFFLYRTLF
jgi:hypothetical protein